MRKNYARALIIGIAVLVLGNACSKNDTPDPYADVFDEYDYKNIGYDEIVNKESEYIIVVGDLQYITMPSANIENLRIIIDWIRSQLSNGVRIKGILQTGDMTQSNSDAQWRIFNSHTLHLRRDIPTFMCTGNHDYQSTLGKNITDRASTKYSNFIDYDDEAAPLIGSMVQDRHDNALLSLDVNGDTIYILSLEFSPRFVVTRWANEVLALHPDKPVILLTHDYLNGAGELTSELGQEWLSHNDQGAGLWEKLVKTNDNIRTVLCGHNTFVAKKVSENDAGNQVTQVMFNPQNMPGGGDGWIQIWEIDPDMDGKINVSTYNIFRKEIRRGDNSTFSFMYK